MIYLSKGVVQKNSTREKVHVARGGQQFLLAGAEAELWLKGRFSFAQAHFGVEEQNLCRLAGMGLVETEAEESDTAKYRILSRCICCPVKTRKLAIPVSTEEKAMLAWIQKAGIRLTTAELVYLQEHRIWPEERLLYEENRQALVETIYTKDTIADNILENQMESAASRDETVHILMQLLKKKRILIL